MPQWTAANLLLCASLCSGHPATHKEFRRHNLPSCTAAASAWAPPGTDLEIEVLQEEVKNRYPLLMEAIETQDLPQHCIAQVDRQTQGWGTITGWIEYTWASGVTLRVEYRQDIVSALWTAPEGQLPDLASQAWIQAAADVGISIERENGLQSSDVDGGSTVEFIPKDATSNGYLRVRLNRGGSIIELYWVSRR